MKALVARVLKPRRILTAQHLSEGIAKAREGEGVDLAVLDLSLPDSAGPETVVRFRREFPEIPVMVVSSLEEPGVIEAVFGAGAAGFVSKSAPVHVMSDVLRRVWAGETGVTPAPNAASAPTSLKLEPGIGLTERQLEVLRGIVNGHSNKEIARALGISENTVKQHTKAVFHELGVNTRTEALVAAIRRGFVVS